MATKSIIGAFSPVQIIYMAEVGAIVIKSEIPLDLWKLFLVFMERTLIAIPLIVLFACSFQRFLPLLFLTDQNRAYASA